MKLITKTLILHLIVIIAMSDFSMLTAQVTIGSNLSPRTGALLDLK